MALSSFVYISEITNLSDARYAAGMGVDLLGFNLDPNSESALSQLQFNEISEWISGVKIVGEFGKLDPESVSKRLDEFAVDYLLISDESRLHEFEMLGLPLIFKVDFEEADQNSLLSTLNYCSGSVDYFLLSSDHEDVSQIANILIQSLDGKYPLLLGYGLHASNIAEVAADKAITGISMKGSPELRPGYKDFDELAEILESIEID